MTCLKRQMPDKPLNSENEKSRGFYGAVLPLECGDTLKPVTIQAFIMQSMYSLLPALPGRVELQLRWQVS